MSVRKASGASATALVVLHGANNTPSDISQLDARIRRGVTDRKLAFDQVIVPSWRADARIQLGAAKQTVPTSPGRRRGDVVLALSRRGITKSGILAAVTDIGQLERWEWLKSGDQLLGDVMAYNRHRATIHAGLRATLAKIRCERIVAVGHSLGGIALVDYLAEVRDPRVVAVVTVGSQAPLMYAFDALVGLPYGGDVRPFTPWVNVWDRRDFLSFLAHDVFKTTSEDEWPILDVEVASGRWFREAHGAYWDQEGTWAALALAANQGLHTRWQIPDAPMTEAQIMDLLRKLRAELHEEYTAKVDEVNRLKAEDRDLRLKLLEAKLNHTWAQYKLSVQEHTFDEVRWALESIDDGGIPPIELEQTGVVYYKDFGDTYALAHGRIDIARADQLLVAYAPLRPEDWELDSEPWLRIIADAASDVTTEARNALQRGGAQVFQRYKTSAEAAAAGGGTGDGASEA